MEPWGLVVNEAAATGLPLLVSDRAGCVETLVPDPAGTTGRRFDPGDVADLAAALTWMAHRPDVDRAAMGERAAAVVAGWGPERFAAGMLEAIGFALVAPGRAESRRPLQGAHGTCRGRRSAAPDCRDRISKEASR